MDEYNVYKIVEVEGQAFIEEKVAIMLYERYMEKRKYRFACRNMFYDSFSYRH